MTDHSPNDQFHASSFMQGHNAEYLEQLYAQYAGNPNAVDAAWAEFFRTMGDDEVSVKRDAQGPSWARADWPPQPGDDLTGALTGEWSAPPPAEAKAAGKKIAAKAAEKGAELTDEQIRRAVLDSIRALIEDERAAIRAGAIEAFVYLSTVDEGLRAEAEVRLVEGTAHAKASMRARSKNLLKMLERLDKKKPAKKKPAKKKARSS